MARVDYTYPASGDDYYQAICAGCGWSGEERHIADYLDAGDDLSEEFADTFASADAETHEFYCQQ